VLSRMSRIRILGHIAGAVSVGEPYEEWFARIALGKMWR
jgi:hypothetical protein